MSQIKVDLTAVLEKMSPPNIVVIGRTGSGKSTLINAVFGADFARTGTGLPVSGAFVRYPKPLDEKSIVVVYDSAGYEVGKEFQFKNNVMEFLKQKRSLSLEEQIHLAWYVVHVGLKRFEHFDAEIISLLRSERVPVIVVLSQADLGRPEEKSALQQTIRSYKDLDKLGLIKIVELAANPMSGVPYGVSELAEFSTALLPELYTEAFIARQVTDLKLKRKLAAKYVKAAAAGCFASGFVPLPNTTPVATVASQTLLCTKIASLYGHGQWVEILDKAGGVTMASMLTVAITSVLDFFGAWLPPSTMVTGALAGAVAATYITVIGLTYTSVFEKLTIKDLTGSERSDVEEFIRKTFKEEFKKNIKVSIRSENDLDKIDMLF